MFVATKNLDAQKQVSLVWQVVGALHKCGIFVVCVIADGLSTNRKTFDIINSINAIPIYVKILIYAIQIFLFFVDQPAVSAKNNSNQHFFSSKPNRSRMLK